MPCLGAQSAVGGRLSGSRTSRLTSRGRPGCLVPLPTPLHGCTIVFRRNGKSNTSCGLSTLLTEADDAGRLPRQRTGHPEVTKGLRSVMAKSPTLLLSKLVPVSPRFLDAAVFSTTAGEYHTPTWPPLTR